MDRPDKRGEVPADGLDPADQIEWLRTPEEEELRRTLLEVHDTLLAVRNRLLQSILGALAPVVGWLDALLQRRRRRH